MTRIRLACLCILTLAPMSCGGTAGAGFPPAVATPAPQSVQGLRVLLHPDPNGLSPGVTNFRDALERAVKEAGMVPVVARGSRYGGGAWDVALMYGIHKHGNKHG